MKTIISLFAITFAGTAFAANNCISGNEMESGATQVAEQHHFYYQWQQTQEELPSRPNRSYGMFLYVPALGDYIRGFDWSYCPETNTLEFPDRALYTRTFQRMVYGDTLVIVEYKPNTGR